MGFSPRKRAASETPRFESWPEDDVNDRLEEMMVDAFDDLTAVYEREDLDSFRTAAYINALEKVEDAYLKERG